MASRVGGTAVRAGNALTAHWAAGMVLTATAHRAAGTRDGTVLSTTGVRPLPMSPADCAAGPSRDELSEALGLAAAKASAGARELLATSTPVAGTAPAVGLWTERALGLGPAVAVGRGTDPVPYPEYDEDAYGLMTEPEAIEA